MFGLLSALVPGDTVPVATGATAPVPKYSVSALNSSPKVFPVWPMFQVRRPVTTHVWPGEPTLNVSPVIASFPLDHATLLRLAPAPLLRLADGSPRSRAAGVAAWTGTIRANAVPAAASPTRVICTRRATDLFMRPALSSELLIGHRRTNNRLRGSLVAGLGAALAIRCSVASERS